MKPLEWLVILFVYLAAYGVWWAFEAYRERTPYKPTNVRRHAVRFGLFTLCLLGLGAAYETPTVQERLQRNLEVTPIGTGEAEGSSRTARSSQRGEARATPPSKTALFVATPPLLTSPSATASITVQDVPEPSVAKMSQGVHGTSSPGGATPLDEPTPEPAHAPKRSPTPTPLPTQPAVTQPSTARTLSVPTKPKPAATEPLQPSAARPPIVRAERALRTFDVTFQSDPPGATLYIGGERVGVTPTRVSLEAGKQLHYTLRAEANVPNHRLYYPHLDLLEVTRDTALSVWLERLNEEEVAALEANGEARELPFDSF